jgi:hypothetical protein
MFKNLGIQDFVFRVSPLTQLLWPFMTDLEEPGSNTVAAQSAAATVVLLCRSLSAQPSPALLLCFCADHSQLSEALPFIT